MELWVVQEQQLAFAILATKYHVGNSCWSSGSLLPCSAKSPQFSHSVQILPFPLIFLLFTFTGPYNSVRDVCHFPCAHRHTSPPFFTYFHLTVSASSPPSALKQYQQTYCMVRSQNSEKYKYSLLSSRAEALLVFLSKGVCICTHVCDHKPHTPQVPLECSLWTRHEALSVWRACVTHSGSLIIC